MLAQVARIQAVLEGSGFTATWVFHMHIEITDQEKIWLIKRDAVYDVSELCYEVRETEVVLLAPWWTVCNKKSDRAGGVVD